MTCTNETTWARRLVALELFGILAASASSLGAAPISLADLVNTGGAIISDGRLFSDFQYSATGDMPPIEGVNVIAFEESRGTFGLRFQGGFLDAPDPAQEASDALITFRVSVTDGGESIGAADLAANMIARDGGSATVTGSFLPRVSTIDQMLRLPTGDDRLVDTVVFANPQRELWVQKNILLRANDSQVDVSFVDQTFHQVPEPQMMAMLALIGVCFHGSVRRIRDGIE